MSDFLESSLADFAEEAREHIAVLNRDLLEIEDKGHSAQPELVNEAFRAIHTIKGLSGMLGLGAMNELAHSMEDLLDLVRHGDLTFGGRVSQAFFSGLDALAQMVEAAAVGGNTEQDVGNTLIELSAAVREAEGSGSKTTDEGPQGLVLEKSVPSAPPASAGADANDEAAIAYPTASSASRSIRVDAAKLDRILTLVGELVILRSRYGHIAGRVIGDLALSNMASREAASLKSEVNEVESSMSRTLGELQDAVMTARLVPLETVFDRLRRTVRDIAALLGKRVRFRSTGGETELDKKMTDQIGDPLMHMVRNAVDHGIESPQARRAAGKSEEGCVTISARHEGDRVVIEVSDDGRGLDSDAILAKAVARKILTPERASKATSSDVLDVISAPGFTTSKKITDVSGRGVGMDVVREALAGLKGTLELDSAAGEGSTFRIRLPLTMAIVDALLVAVEDESYAIAVSSVRQIVEVSVEAIHRVGESEFLQTGKQVLPLLRLAGALGACGPDGPRHTPGQDSEVAKTSVADSPITAADSRLSDRLSGHDDTQTTVIIDSGSGEVGLVVDRVLGQQEIVVKALSRRFEAVAEISGGSILGDGSVCLILDAAALVAKANESVTQAVDHASEVAS